MYTSSENLHNNFRAIPKEKKRMNFTLEKLILKLAQAHEAVLFYFLRNINCGSSQNYCPGSRNSELNYDDLALYCFMHLNKISMTSRTLIERMNLVRKNSFLNYGRQLIPNFRSCFSFDSLLDTNYLCSCI